MCDLSLTAQDDEIKHVIESDSETIQSIDNQKQLQENKYAPTSKSKISVLPQGVDMRFNSSPQCGEEAILSEQTRTLGVQVRGEINSHTEEQYLQSDTNISRHSECNEESQNREDFTIDAMFRAKALNMTNVAYKHSRHTEEQHLQSAECRLKTRAVCKTFQPNEDTFNANVVIGKRKYPVTNSKDLSCKKDSYIEITNQLDCFGSKEPHNDDNSRYSRHSECNEVSHNRENITNNAILRGLNNCSPQNDGKNSCRLMRGEGATHVANSNNSRKVAFTLAEVLITLGIIGIVAALTLSSVITNYKEKQTVAQLKKTYSVLAQAFELAKQEYGNVSTWGLGGMYDPQTHITLANNFKRYMKVGTDCVGKSHEYTSKHCVDGSYSDRASYATFYTSDGTLLIFRNWWTSGNANRGTVNIDINGRKGPNTFGKDIFLVFILNDKLLPAGAPEDIYKFEKGCNRLITNPYPGYLKQYGACTAWVLFNENMDYLHCDGLSWTGAKSCKELKQQN